MDDSGITKNIISRSILFILLVISVNSLSAQSTSIIKEKGIKSKTFYVQDIESGDKKMQIDKIETYNEKGQLVDLKVYDDEGRNAKDWFQYKYDANGNVIEEIEYDSRQKLKERIVHIFKNGLKVEKQYFDNKGRMTKKKVYEYQY